MVVLFSLCMLVLEVLMVVMKVFGCSSLLLNSGVVDWVMVISMFVVVVVLLMFIICVGMFRVCVIFLVRVLWFDKLVINIFLNG